MDAVDAGRTLAGHAIALAAPAPAVLGDDGREVQQVLRAHLGHGVPEVVADGGVGLRHGGDAEPADARLDVARHAVATVQVDVPGPRLRPLEAALGGGHEIRQRLLVLPLTIESAAPVDDAVGLDDVGGRGHLAPCGFLGGDDDLVRDVAEAGFGIGCRGGRRQCDAGRDSRDRAHRPAGAASAQYSPSRGA